MNTPLHPFRALSGLRRPPTAPSSLPLLFPRPSNPQHQQRRTIRSILKPPPRRTRYVRGPTALTPSATLARRAAATPQRTGLLARKKGMAALFDPDERAAGEGSGRGGGGHRLRACTVLQVDGCMVVGHKTRARDGYWAVQVGCEAGERGADPAAARTGGAVGARRGVGSAMRGVYARRGLPPRRIVAECRVRGPRGLLPLGTPLVPSWFVVGQVVDTRSRTKGKGFQGVSFSLFRFASGC
jgi:large subunit ribosomal protein L3